MIHISIKKTVNGERRKKARSKNIGLIRVDDYILMIVNMNGHYLEFVAILLGAILDIIYIFYKTTKFIVFVN